MENLGFGLAITVVGMGSVFGLLAALWLLLTLALRLERRSQAPGGDAVVAPVGSPGPAASPVVLQAADVPSGPMGAAPAVFPGIRLAGAPADLDPRLVAAVAVVIERHVETRRRQAAPAMRSYWPGSLLFASRWIAAGRMRQAQSWRRRGR